MNKYFLIILLFLILTSCKKEQTKLIHISAKNPVTGVSYPNLTYTISEEILGTNEPIKVVFSGTLDSKGEANIELKVKKNHIFLLKLNEPPNTCNGSIDTLFINHNSSITNFNYEFTPCAFLKNNLVNVNCQGSSDKLRLYYRSTSQHLSGCNSWLPANFSNVVMGQYDYKWIVERGNEKDTFYDSFYLSEGEYKTYQLNY